MAKSKMDTLLISTKQFDYRIQKRIADMTNLIHIGAINEKSIEEVYVVIYPQLVLFIPENKEEVSNFLQHCPLKLLEKTILWIPNGMDEYSAKGIEKLGCIIYEKGNECSEFINTMLDYLVEKGKVTSVKPEEVFEFLCDISESKRTELVYYDGSTENISEIAKKLLFLEDKKKALGILYGDISLICVADVINVVEECFSQMEKILIDATYSCEKPGYIRVGIFIK